MSSDKRCISFVVPGAPMPLQRARITTRGKFARMYDTEKNTDNKLHVAMIAAKAMGKQSLIEDAVEVNLWVYIEKPKSKQRKNSDPYPMPTAKPDLDNCVKLIFDALNGIAWVDDKQVCTLTCGKRWADERGARTVVEIYT